MKSAIFSFGLLAAILAGCAPPAPPVDLGPVSQDDFNAWDGKGPSTIVGQAFLLTNGGDVKTCAGQQVYLVPDNNYDSRFMAAAKEGYRTNANASLIAANTRTTTCDANGDFEFDNVPAETWVIDTGVKWFVPEADGALDPQGGGMDKTIVARPGSQKVILSSSDETT